MKKYALLVVGCLAMFFAAVGVHAQVGFTGPQGTGGYGFTGQVQNIPVAQVQSFAHKTPVIVTGTIVQAIGQDRYLFRDSSGETILKIGPKEWMYFGSTIGSSDTIEISGEVHRHRKDWQRPAEIHARFIRKL